MIKALLAIVPFLGVSYYLFPLAYVSGNSMLPTYHEGQVLLCRRVLKKRSFRPKSGSVYVFKAPYDSEKNRLVIKRVHFTVEGHTPHSKSTYYCQLLGDNPKESYDSRQYGLVDTSLVVAKVITKVTR